MSFIDNALGTSPQVLAVRGRRAALLAANIANADTPGYKARDLDFSAVFAAEIAGQKTLPLASTKVSHSRHIALANTSEALYRIPLQPSLDGNTVEMHLEQAAFMDNAVRYQASANFLDGKIRTLIGALKGE